MVEMIIGTTPATTVTPDARLGFWGVILGIIVSAIVSYIVSKVQANSDKKNLKIQIQAEIEKVEQQYNFELQKIEKQYTFEQKRDNTNFIVKLRVEKATELISALDELIGLSSYYYNNSIKKSKKEIYDSKKLTQFTSIETKVSILINYFSVLRVEWNDAKIFLKETEQTFIEVYLDKSTLTRSMELEIYEKNIQYQSKLSDISKNVSKINDEILNKLEE